MTKIWYEGINGFNNPIFKDALGNRYGSTEQLYSMYATAEEVLSSIKIDMLTYFGSKFNSEPMGTEVSDLVLTTEEFPKKRRKEKYNGSRG